MAAGMKFDDRARETSTAPGTGNFTMNGAVQGAITFATFMTNTGDYTTYEADNGTAFETGYLTKQSDGTYARTPKRSTNGNAAVNFSTGLVSVSCDLPAWLLDHLNLIEESLASASTTDLGSIQSKCIQLTGTVTPTSFGNGKNKERLVRYTGAGLTITTSATLHYLGLTSLTLATNDIFCAVSDNSSTPIWRIMWVRRAGGGVPVTYGIDGATSAQKDQARANIAVPADNVIINGDFRVNQRVYVSAATLAAGAYGHDRWKAGASGGNYSFTQLASSTQITIAASKTLIQVIEDKNVVGGNYVLSWTGTCQARYAINSATPAGSYASSPILIAGQAAGFVMSIEFGNGASSGTLGTVKLESGTVASPFIMRKFILELEECQRYFEKSYDLGTAPGAVTSGDLGLLLSVPSNTVANGQLYPAVIFKVDKRVTPTVTLYGYSGGLGKVSNPASGADLAAASANIYNNWSKSFISYNNSGVSVTASSNLVALHYTAECEL